jgi:hypothetical protein
MEHQFVRVAAGLGFGVVATALASAQHTTRVSVDPSGVEGDDRSFSASLSADGRFVVFVSYATNLVAGSDPAVSDVFLHDRKTGAVTQVNVDSSGIPGDSYCERCQISGDGRFVALAGLAVVDVSGTPLFAWIAFGTFDGSGSWSLTAVVPPGLAGNVFTLQGFGIVETLRAAATNRVAISIQ